jgi:hypothetical protein
LYFRFAAAVGFHPIAKMIRLRGVAIGALGANSRRMKLVIFGSSGMVGQGVLREALLDSSVTQVTAVVRAPSGQMNPKLREIVHGDLSKLDGLDLTCDACVFAVGVGSAGMSDEAYGRVTYDLAVSTAQAVLSARQDDTRVRRYQSRFALLNVRVLEAEASSRTAGDQ